MKLKGSGFYLPERIVTSLELDEKLGLKLGTFEFISGVKSRRYASDEESASVMGAKAALAAIEDANLNVSDIDLILGACGTMEQAIPCNAALIQRELKQIRSGVPCFDINSTCLSFVTALQVASNFIAQGMYRNILIVSSEVASVGLNYNQHEASSLFGDGAAAVVVGKAENSEDKKSFLLGFHMETYASGWDSCQIEGGGTRLHPSRLNWKLEHDDSRFQFKMQGPKIFRMVLKVLPEFMKTLEKKSGVSLNDVKLLIPHQASFSALELIRQKLALDPERMMNIIEEHGNMIAASMPLALHYALKSGRLKSGDHAIMIGTSAGFSIGGVAIQI